MPFYSEHSLKALCAGVLLFLSPFTASASSSIPDPEPSTGWQDKEAVRAERFMAVTAHPLATRAAYQLLKAGGNAADAAVTAQLVLNLVEPQSSGIGGGAFMLYWDAVNKKLSSFDGRETAPDAADADYFKDSTGELIKWREACLLYTSDAADE